jgi:hypothetical protein
MRAQNVTYLLQLIPSHVGYLLVRGTPVRVKLSLSLTKYHAMETILCLTMKHVMKMYEGLEVYLHVFLT